MPLIVSQDVDNLRSSSINLASQLQEKVKKGTKTWTHEQAVELGLMYQIVMNTHDALYRIVDANKE